MTLLSVIWESTLVLAGGAVLWMSALIVLRMVAEQRERRLNADRKALEAALIATVQGGGDPQRDLAPFCHRGPLMAETLLNLLALVRGADRDRLLGTLEALDLPRTLRGELGGGSLAGRLVCLEALAAFPGPDTDKALRMAVERGPPAMRLAALRSLYETRGELPLGKVLRQLETGELPASAAVGEFLRILIGQEPATAAAELRHSLLPEPIQLMIIDGLASAGEYTVLSTIMNLAQAPSSAVRAAAIHALGVLNHPVAEPAVANGLVDPEWSVRAAAAEAAGVIGLASLATALTTSLGDSVWRVRFMAAAALVKLGPDGRRRLQAAAASASSPAAETAALALAEQGLAG